MAQAESRNKMINDAIRGAFGRNVAEPPPEQKPTVSAHAGNGRMGSEIKTTPSMNTLIRSVGREQAWVRL